MDINLNHPSYFYSFISVKTITRDVVLLDDGMINKPTRKELLYAAGRVANCITFSSDMTCDQVHGTLMAVFGEKLSHLPVPKYVHGSLRGTEYNVLTINTVIQLLNAIL